MLKFTNLYKYQSLVFIFIFSLGLFFTTLAQEAPAKKGKIAGKITDAKTGEEIIGATVSVEGSTKGASSDLDGRYFLELPAGTYNINISYVSYKPKKIQGVVIVAGELNSINVSIAEDSKELEEVVIVGEARKESSAGLLLQQKNAVAVTSGISADLIRKMPDRTTADVIKRVSGASIQDGKFAIIRGLGDRYNYGMINGAPLPSSETDRKAFSLDIVPAQVVDNLIISKTATPDMPGDFAGGIIQINTKDIPDENTFFGNIGIGGHSLTTFKEFYKPSQAGGTDFLGFDDGSRQLPTAIANIPFNQYRLLDPQANSNQLTNDSRSFNNNFVPDLGKASPNFSLQLGGSKRMKLFNNDFGMIAALTYNNANKNIPTSIITANLPDNSTTFSKTANNYNEFVEYTNSRNNVNIGGILNFTYKIGQNNKLFFKNLLTENAENNSYTRSNNRIQDVGNFVNGVTTSPLNVFQKQYVNNYSSNRMYSAQFSGEHFLPTSKIKLKYIFGYNNLYRSVPDYKYLTYSSDGTSTDAYLASVTKSGGGPTTAGDYTGRLFSKLSEYSYSANVEASIPFYAVFKNEIKTGGLYQYRSRQFDSRQFTLASFFNGNPQVLTPQEVFSNQNLSAPGANFFNETTEKYFSYTASSKLYAGFLMLETKFTSKFKAIYGVRVESYNQNINGFDANNGNPVNIDITWTDVLPSANLIYSLNDKFNLRGSYSRTVSRPEFREVSPLVFYDFNINAVIKGNQNLVRTNIDNVDFKVEYYPMAGSIFSVNPFLKLFKNPIEQIAEAGNSVSQQFTYGNAASANNYGVELEARFTPAIFSKAIPKGLEGLTIYANYALIKSSVDLSGTSNANIQRPLQGQSPYIINAGVQYNEEKSGWDFSLAFNQVGRRIAYISTQKQYMIWENPRLIMDFSVTKSFKNDKYRIRAIAGDLLAQDLVFYSDVNDNGQYDSNDVTSFKYRNGQTITIQGIFSF